MLMLFQPDSGAGQAVYSRNINISTSCLQSRHRCFLHTAAVSLCKIRIFYGLSEFRLHICCTNVSVAFAGTSSCIYSAGMCFCFIYSLVGAQLCGLWSTEGDILAQSVAIFSPHDQS